MFMVESPIFWMKGTAGEAVQDQGAPQVAKFPGAVKTEEARPDTPGGPDGMVQCKNKSVTFSSRFLWISI
jgi:hypothetical protein